jgi:hypothetical protein
MNNNGNGTLATITPPNRTGIMSETRHNSNDPTPGKGPDNKATKKQTLKLDARLEPICDAIELQPKAIHVTLSDTAITMLLVTRKLREKRAGLVNLTTNTDLYPCSANLLVKLDFPKELKDDEQTLENVKEWNDYVKHIKDELKKRIVKQGERTAKFYQEAHLKNFFKLILVIAEGLATWHGKIERVTNTPLSTHAYGAVSIYCYFNTLDPRHELFTYLCEDQDLILKYFKQTYLTTASGKPLFSNKQLQDLSMLLPDAEDNHPATPPASPLRLHIDIDPGNDGSSMVVPPGANTTCAPVRLTTQPVQQQIATPATADDEDPTPPVPPKMEMVVYKVKDVLSDLVPPFFLDLARTVDVTQAEKKANAKLKAVLRQTKTIDMAKLLEANLATQQTVTPENMAVLVNSLIDQRIQSQAKQNKKALLKTTRKKSLGGAKAAKTSPGKHNNGGKPNGILKSNKQVAFNPEWPLTKQPKRHNTSPPNANYNRLWTQCRTPNPYANRPWTNNQLHYTPNTPGRGTGSGRGRGRGQNQGRRLQQRPGTWTRTVLTKYLATKLARDVKNIKNDASFNLRATANRVYGFVPNIK